MTNLTATNSLVLTAILANKSIPVDHGFITVDGEVTGIMVNPRNMLEAFDMAATMKPTSNISFQLFTADNERIAA